MHVNIFSAYGGFILSWGTPVSLHREDHQHWLFGLWENIVVICTFQLLHHWEYNNLRKDAFQTQQSCILEKKEALEKCMLFPFSTSTAIFSIKWNKPNSSKFYISIAPPIHASWTIWRGKHIVGHLRAKEARSWSAEHQKTRVLGFHLLLVDVISLSLVVVSLSTICPAKGLASGKERKYSDTK